jgi:hypothetical protein
VSNPYEMGSVPVHHPVRAEEPYIRAEGNWHSTSGLETAWCGAQVRDTCRPRESDFDVEVAAAKRLLAGLARASLQRRPCRVAIRPSLARVVSPG